MTDQERGQPVLEVKKLRVEFDELVAVNDVSIQVYPGMICGLLGPNGAGKTTLMSCIAGLIEATYGEIIINSHSLYESRSLALSELGFQPDVPPMPDGLSVYEFLELFASAYALRPSIRKSRIDELLSLVKLTDHRDAPADSLSRGMRQRLFLAKTMLPAPQLMVLDEPASGLDPLARRDLAELIKELAKQGVAIVISSHVLEELNGVCDSLAVMARGKVLDQGRIEEVRARLKPPPEIELKFLEGVNAQVEGALQQHYGSRLLALDPLGEPQVGYVARLHREADVAESADFSSDLKSLIEGGLSPTHFAPREANLQDLFLALTDREEKGGAQ